MSSLIGLHVARRDFHIPAINTSIDIYRTVYYLKYPLCVLVQRLFLLPPPYQLEVKGTIGYEKILD